jgi:hypothetical protein
MTYNEEVSKIRNQISNLQKKLDQKLKKCPHEQLESKEFYNEGSYFDKAYTTTWDECVVCHTRFNMKHKEHSWYG